MIEDFSKLLDWFGPLENLDVFFQKVVNLLRQPYVLTEFAYVFVDSLVDGSLVITHLSWLRKWSRKQPNPDHFSSDSVLETLVVMPSLQSPKTES